MQNVKEFWALFLLFILCITVQYGVRKGAAPFQSDLGDNRSMMYCYNYGTGVQMYPLDGKLLKEYLKRQM